MASFFLRQIRSMSTMNSPSPAPSPWLMLPPLFKGGDMLYNFYSLADDQVFTYNKRRRGGVLDSDQIPPDYAKLVGSSHGWLASFDENSNHVFLSNPISGRHIRLPAVDTLPDPHINLFEGRGSVTRVILSDGEARHAMMTYGPGSRLAFCSPAAGAHRWSPLGARLSWFKDRDEHVKFAVRPWEDMVYWTRNGVFSTIQPLAFDLNCHFVRDRYGRNEKHCEMYHWQIPQGYVGESSVDFYDTWNKSTRRYEEDEDLDLETLERQCIQMPHLVCIEHEHEHLSNHPLIVMRFLHRGIGNNSLPSDEKLARPEVYRAMINTFPYRSVDFLLLRCEEEHGFSCWKVVKDLKGLAIFVGMNHSFAIPATGKLKPNSIYFADAGRITPPDPDAPKIYGGHDIGIYDYENKTISPCYYPCDFKSFNRIDPPPMWFTPTFN